MTEQEYEYIIEQIPHCEEVTIDKYSDMTYINFWNGPSFVINLDEEWDTANEKLLIIDEYFNWLYINF